MTAMSAACIHPISDAPLHPECQGCQSVTADEVRLTMQAERAAFDEAPRPGTWCVDHGSDGRFLTQEQTDLLIRAELVATASRHRRREVAEACHGYHLGVTLSVTAERPYATAHQVPASHQRGGIDSDPLVRVLAFRAWADRDRRWFEERGVRKGELCSLISLTGATDASEIHGSCAVAWPHDPTRLGQAANDAWPGQRVGITGTPRRYRVSDRPRVPPAFTGEPDEPAEPAELAFETGADTVNDVIAWDRARGGMRSSRSQTASVTRRR